MWKVVFCLNVVWNLYAIEASHHEPYYEYLYVRRDGVALIEPLSIPIFGNDAGNETTYLINNNPKLMDQETIQALRRRPQRWKGLSESIDTISKRPRKRNFRRKHDTKKDEQLLLIQKAVKFDEESQCVVGKTTFVNCNHCVCMGGQLYLCTVRKCGYSGLLKFRRENNKKVTRCIEGEQIRSFDSCNRCYCGGGQVICTRKKCLKQSQNQTQDCVPGKRIKSPDKCNTCTCNTRGVTVCTSRACGPELSKNIEDQVCIPNTWFSLRGSIRCKECYCINGKVAFCYMSLCTGKSAKHPSLSVPGSLPDRCQMHDYVQEKCTRCECGANGVWICQSKIVTEGGHCPSAVPEELQNYNREHRRLMKFSLKETDILSNILPLSVYQLYRPKRTIKSTSTKIQDFDRTSGLESEDENYDRTTGPEYENYDRTIGIEPEDGNYYRTTGLDTVHEMPEISFSGESMAPESTGAGVGKFPPGKGSQKSAALGSGKDTNIDRGPHCVTGQFFTQGTDLTCHGCFCTPTNEWKCWSIKGACRGSVPCNPGKMKKNPVAPCSVCYCGVDRTSYCATDELCSYSIKPSKCEAIDCLNYCATTNANFGVCHNDKCVCVH